MEKVKPGECLQEDVNTQSGNILFYKGKVITARDIEILKAFFIKMVTVGEDNPANASPTAENPENDAAPLPTTFLIDYEKMIHLMKKVFSLASSGNALPILDVRMQLEKLLEKINLDIILFFHPRGTKQDDYLFHKSIRVAMTSYLLAKWTGMQTKDWMPVALGGLLHDIGNAKVDFAVIEKKGKLDVNEFDEMKKHTIIGYHILKNVAAVNEGVKLCALQHHEKEDGSGYPLGLQSEKIHPYAKIIAISDIFHAMTSDNFYHQAVSPYLALEQMVKESFGKLNPAVVQTFLNKIADFHQGTVVQLNDKRTGQIIFTDKSNPTRPMINSNGEIINLVLHRNLYIEKIIK
ncbi:MAG: HD family phosphohydrolase [Paenibacillus sp. RIFOXYA1_FULL_44_5]|nr:MAG: HD family phosphohydrolase [Paenibacillus sp. RIFOXYA1_FULL_44_5]